MRVVKIRSCLFLKWRARVAKCGCGAFAVLLSVSVEDTLLFLLLSLTAFQMFPVWLNVVQVFEMFRWTNNWNDVEVAIFLK